MIHLEDIIEKVESYYPQADVDSIWNAYMVCAKAHRGQMRKSGSAYLSHPLEVAYILAQLRMDPTTVAAGLLHDIIEDTSMKTEELREYFGEEVTQLVDGVTKLTKMDFSSNEEQQAENFRKMILAMAKDIRVIIIKLADRLHNMRTLDHLPEHKWRRIAGETLDFYAPLANRLGIGWIKYELEDAAFKHLWSEEYQEIKRKVSAKLEERNAYVSKITEIVSKEMENSNIKGHIAGRSKHFYSIFEKMKRQDISFEEVYDLVGIRVIAFAMPDCYTILGLVHSLWKPIPGRFKDYVALPKSNMYQSLHTTVIGPEGQRAEFQIRTEEMHKIAEEGIASHWQYKEGKATEDQYQDKINWLRQLLESQQELKDPREFLEAVKIDLFPDDAYVFTPAGDVRRLPRGSTIIDFAYLIHTDIGHKCSGARVNGRMVPLKYELKNGDRVEVITSPNHKPSRDWLNIVKTSRARTKIKAWLKAEQRKWSVALGKELAEKELKRHHVNISKIIGSEKFQETVNRFGFSAEEDLLAAIGYGKLSVLQAFKPYLPEEAAPPKKKVQQPEKPLDGTGIRVGGLENENIMVRIAKCCSPVPGDDIVGFITRGRGLSGHSVDCPSVHMLEYDSERMIQVEWETDKENTYSVKIYVVTWDKAGLLAKISSAIASRGVDIREANVETRDDKKAYLHFIIEIADLSHLKQVLSSISKIEGVLSVKRGP